MPGDRHGGVTACRYCGAHNLENVSCGCVGYGLVRLSIECLCFWCREELLQPESGSCPCDTSTAAHPPSSRRQAVRSFRSARLETPDPGVRVATAAGEDPRDGDRS